MSEIIIFPGKRKPAPWVMGRRWNVIQAMPNSELLAASTAREMGWGVFYPCYWGKRRPHRGKAQQMTLPYLPGYLFVADDRFLSLWELSKAKGISSVLRCGSEYAFIDDTDPVMTRLLRMADDDGYVAWDEDRKPITMFQKDETVRLQNCPFELFPAVIDAIDESRNGAWVWVKMFGGKTRVHVDYEQLEKII